MGKSKGRNHGRSIWSRQMEYANMRTNARIELSELKSITPKLQKEFVLPQHTPLPPMMVEKLLTPPTYRIEVEIPNGTEPLILHRTGRREAEGLLKGLKKKFNTIIGKITNLR